MRCPDATFFHSIPWAKVLRETYGYSPVYFSTPDTVQPPFLLPVMEVASWITGRRGASLPFTDECGPCGSLDYLRVAFRKLLSFGAQRRWKYYEVRRSLVEGDGLAASTSFYGHRLALQAGAPAVFSGFESAVRRAIRKAEIAGVTIEFSQEPTAVRVFYNLLCKTRARHGLPPQPYRFFENIYHHILQAGDGRIAIAKLKGAPLAAVMFFHFGRMAIYKFAASDDTFQHLRGSNFVLWKAIEDYAQTGFTLLDFGRTSLANSGLRRFKLSWGATERRIDYIRYSHHKSSFVRSADRSVESWRTILFRALPESLSRLIGAGAYKHLG